MKKANWYASIIYVITEIFLFIFSNQKKYNKELFARGT